MTAATTTPPAGSDGPVLAATNLVIEYATRRGRVRSLDGATLAIRPGQIMALVGESGSGKSTLGMATGRLLAANAEHIGGRLHVLGQSVFDIDARRLRALRSAGLAYIFQNPIAALDPTMRVGRQVRLATPERGWLATPERGSRQERRDRQEAEPAESPEQALDAMGLRDVPRVLRSYPHELSGGMAQRVAIAMALRRRPRLMVADEPTAAVDATLRTQILTLLVDSCRRHNCALLLLTHDLHAVAEHTERIAVMYGGRIVEAGPTADVLAEPMHPYTQALIGALPGEERPGQRLDAIRGVPPILRDAAPGCAFAPRCPRVLDQCATARPAHTATAGRELACHLHATAPAEHSSSGGKR